MLTFAQAVRIAQAGAEGEPDAGGPAAGHGGQVLLGQIAAGPRRGDSVGAPGREQLQHGRPAQGECQYCFIDPLIGPLYFYHNRYLRLYV